MIGLYQLSQPGVETDDLMYSLTIMAEKGSSVVIVTSDKDMGQSYYF